MPSSIFSVIPKLKGAFTPYDWSTYNSDMEWRIDLTSTASYVGTGTSVTSLGPGGGTWTVQGDPPFQQAGYAKYFNLDGSSDAYYSNTNYTYSSTYTYWVWGAWVWYNTTATTVKRVIFGIEDSSLDSIQFTVNRSAGGVYGIMAYMNNASTQTTFNTSINPDTWNFLCFDHNMNTNTVTLYKNGVSATTITSQPVINVALERYVIGATNGSGTAGVQDWWLGRIPEAFLWRTTANTDRAAMISAIYNGTKGRYGL
jgi:hypothetical protein